MPRAQAETDPISNAYPLCECYGWEKILHYVRGKKAANSVGCERVCWHWWSYQRRGSHAFCFVGCSFQEAVKREVCEELSIQGEFNARPVGLINDDSTEVGRVHFGVVHVISHIGTGQEDEQSLRRSNFSQLRN